jgi:hypothetical protein
MVKATKKVEAKGKGGVSGCLACRVFLVKVRFSQRQFSDFKA